MWALTVQVAAESGGVLPNLVDLPDLGEDLPLTHDQRVKASRDAQQVVCGIAVPACACGVHVRRAACAVNLPSLPLH